MLLIARCEAGEVKGSGSADPSLLTRGLEMQCKKASCKACEVNVADACKGVAASTCNAHLHRVSCVQLQMDAPHFAFEVE